jgi:hypothetical protein
LPAFFFRPPLLKGKQDVRGDCQSGDENHRPDPFR